MQVYANTFRIEGKNACHAVLGAVHGWLKQIMDLQFSLHDITHDNELSNEKSEIRPWLRSYVSTDKDPVLYAWRLKHVCKKVSGRQWVTELGIKLENGVVDFSCSVATEELSTLVREPIDATRPRVVAYVINNVLEADGAWISSDVPGQKIKQIGLHDEDFRAFRSEIERPQRDYPLVLVSPKRNGDFLINRKHLQDALFGLAQVVEISPNFDSYEMEEILGKEWSAWDGALNVIQTKRSNGRVYGVVFRSDEIEALGDTQANRVSHILARVTHNTNVPRLRNRIRPEGVVHLALRRRLEANRLTNSEEPAALTQENKMLWLEVETLEESLLNLQQELDAAELARMETEDQNQELESKLRSAQYKASALEGRGEVESVLPNIDFYISQACRMDHPSPEECLEFISKAYPARCEILESAKKSAKDMQGFQNGRRLLDMLKRLVTNYVDAIKNGGDSQARQVFSADEYSANESETVMRSPILSSKRVFQRNGIPIEMFRHLKIGKADNVSLTLRVHFSWLADEGLIVIGYCGEHLPISSH